MIIEQFKDAFIDEVMSDEWQEEILPLKQMMAYYRCAIMEVETKFRFLNEELSLCYDRNPIESIHSRLKSNASITKKLKLKGYPINVETMEKYLYDIAGLRVVCSFKQDIYHLAQCLLQQDDIRLVKKKDYIQNPKANGYRSLHLIIEVPIFLENEKKWVKVEVQFRTLAMDFWASLEHKLRYKKVIDDDKASYIAYQLLECAQMCNDLDDKMSSIKEYLE